MFHVNIVNAYKIIHLKKSRKETDHIPLILLGKTMKSSIAGNSHNIFIFIFQSQAVQRRFNK